MRKTTRRLRRLNIDVPIAEVGETGATCYKFHFFLHRAMAMMAMGSNFWSDVVQNVNKIMCTISDN